MKQDPDAVPTEDSAKAAASGDRAPSWRAELNDNYCKLRRLERPPTGYNYEGKLVFASEAVANPQGYILWDASRDAPRGSA